MIKLFTLLGLACCWLPLQAQRLTHSQPPPAPSVLGATPALFSDLGLALKHPAQVERLALKNLAVLPAGISRFTQLRELDLSGSRLTTLPAQLGRLQKLEVLNLTGN